MASLQRCKRPQLPIAPRPARPIIQAATDLLRAGGFEPPAELASILTALEYLPARTETDPVRIAERTREKDVIRRRLTNLCQSEPIILKAIEDAIAEIESGGEGKRYDALDQLINSQPYRLSYWRVAAEEINYRRFFDINQLAALRMEETEVFEATHQLVFKLIESGAVTGPPDRSHRWLIQSKGIPRAIAAANWGTARHRR